MKKFEIGQKLNQPSLHGMALDVEVIGRTDTTVSVCEKWIAEDSGELCCNIESHEIVEVDGNEAYVAWTYNGHTGYTFALEAIHEEMTDLINYEDNGDITATDNAGTVYAKINGRYYRTPVNGKKTRIGEAAFEAALKDIMRWVDEEYAREFEEELEQTVEDIKAEEAIREFEEERAAEEAEEARREEELISEGKLIGYEGNLIPVRDGFWADPMNSCFYTVTDTIDGFEICADNASGEMFAIRNFNAEAKKAHKSAQATERASSTAPAPKAKKKAAGGQRKAKKNAAFTTTVDGTEITLTEKQVDFIRHLPDTNFWEAGLDSAIWVDVLCDEIGGQFANKPMTVGAMISTICEKGLGVRSKQRVNGKKCTGFELTELGKAVAKELGLH